MWTFDNPPLERLRRHYGFKPSSAWLEHVRLAALRFNDGGSGSFVSAEGLVLTNHHVAMGQLQKMSSSRRNYVRDGFYARQLSAEVRCPDLEINQLVALENVTRRVAAAIPPGASDKAANAARKAAMAAIEKRSFEATGDRADVVELYQGGEYWLYRYKKYVDVRLVMAPESDTAFFGGDEDNFTYPRFCLDFAFFRVYEGGRPLRPKHHLRWSAGGAREGELTFFVGHPGSTDRLLTLSQLRYQRDIALPKRLSMLAVRKEAVLDFGRRGTEARRRAKDYLFGLENSIKVITGEYEGLRAGEVLQNKEALEAEFRARARADRNLRGLCGRSWERLERLQRELRARHVAYTFRRLSGYRLPGIADAIVRCVAEIEKPNSERYEEFRDSALDSLKHRLFSPAPVYKDLEEALLAAGLRESRERLGVRDPFVRAALSAHILPKGAQHRAPAGVDSALSGLSPEQAAKRALAQTRLDDPAFRKELIAGGRAAVERSNDSLILLSRRLDPFYRAERAWYENRVQSVERAEGNRIAKARFRIFGKKIYPDATFTLRFAYGRPLGYPWNKTRVPYKTTFGGLFDRADGFENAPPYRLPQRVTRARSKLDLSTPLNFASTHDITGGNSGSPVINRRAELVGLIFDGNVQSLASGYAYTSESARAVSVHSSGILSALRDIYGMTGLLRELRARGRTDP